MQNIKRDDIQYLRAFSVLIVVAFHSRAAVMPNGYLGVDIFFFITGFVLWPQLKNMFSDDGYRGLILFIQRRYRRLYPAFLLCTSISLLFLVLFASRNLHRDIGVQALFSLFILGNIGAASLHGNYFNPEPNPFLHFWSLSAEWQIYVLVPLLIFSAFKLFGNHLTLILWSLMLGSFFTQVLSTNQTVFTDYYSPFSRLWEFCVGVLLAKYLSKTNALSKKFRQFLFFGGILLTITIVAPFKYPTFMGQIMAALLFILTILSKPSLRSWPDKILLWIGNHSYSIYLWHLPAISLALYSPSSPKSTVFRAIGLLLAIVISFACAALTYRFIEVPFRRQKRELLPRRARLVTNPSLALVLSLSLIWVSSNFYGANMGSRVSVAWEKHKTCRTESNSICLIAPSSKNNKRILLIGDSHMMQFFDVFYRIGNDEGIRVGYLQSTVTKIANSNLQKNQIVDWNPELIIVSELHASTESIDLFRLGWNWLSNLGIKVLYLNDNPVFKDYLEYKHYAHPSWFSLYFRKPPSFGVHANETDLYKRNASLAFQELVGLSGAQIVDIWGELCKAEICIRKQNGQLIYSDDNHLSVYGASILFNKIMLEIRKLI